MRRVGPETLVERAAAGAAVLDARDERAFAAGHLAGAGNVPRGAFLERRAELPARDVPVVVVAGTGDEAHAAASDLEGMGYVEVEWLDAALAEVAGGVDDRGPAARLWRPAPFLEEVLPGLPRGRALDLAAGSGREAVFLALHGFDVEAWDHAPEALERALALATRHGVQIRTRVVDLEWRQTTIPERAFDLVTVFRFLHRPLFPLIERALAPGGHLVYETYRLGQERHGRPTHARFLLKSGELREAFPLLDVLRYEETEREGGPVTARLCARRG
jgi:rhodanese-related sulfurtransferase